MIGRIDEVVVDCRDPAALAEFWSSVLGGEPVHRNDAWSFIDPPGWTRLAFQRVPETKQGKNRLHIDVHVDDVPAASVAAEALGAVRVGTRNCCGYLPSAAGSGRQRMVRCTVSHCLMGAQRVASG